MKFLIFNSSKFVLFRPTRNKMADSQPSEVEVCVECKKKGAERILPKKVKGPLKGAAGNKMMTSLEIAAADGHVNCLHALLNAGADVNCTNEKNGYTPLMWAAWNGKDECVELLIKEGANVNMTSQMSALILATRNKENVRCVELLLAAGADVNYSDDEEGLTALMQAAGSGNVDVATLLIKAGADVNKVDETETISAIMCSASSREGWKCIEVLAKAGADVNFTGDYKTPLICATEEGCWKSAEALVKAGADVNAVGIGIGEDGWNYLHFAAPYGKDTYKVFIEAGVDVNAQSSRRNETPLMRCLEYDDECAELLIEAGADVNITDSHHATALFRTSKPESVKLLLRSGAQINHRNDKGLNILETYLSRYPGKRKKKVEMFGLILFAAGETVNEVKKLCFVCG